MATEIANKQFRELLRSAINNCSRENASNTPDYILADYLKKCLDVFEETLEARGRYYGNCDIES